MNTVQQLLSDPVIDVNKAAKDWGSFQTPLFVASQEGNLKVVRELLNHPQIDVNQARTDDGATPLYIASQNDHPDVVKILLGHPEIKVNQATTEGLTPLFWAAQDHLEVLRELLKHKEIDVTTANNLGESPLRSFARILEILEVVQRKLLKREEIDVNSPEFKFAIILEAKDADFQKMLCSHLTVHKYYIQYSVNF